MKIFKYPNGTYGVFIFKNGYTSTKSIFSENTEYPTRNIMGKDVAQTTIFLPVRNPVERFCSAVNTMRRDKRLADTIINDFISGLEQKSFNNIHFIPVMQTLRNLCFIFDHIHLYKFPDHYEQMLRDGGYEGEIPHENKSTKKLILTDSQTARVANYYENDMKLFNSIEQAGQKFLLPFA